MGCCLSKKDPSPSSSATPPIPQKKPPNEPQRPLNLASHLDTKKKIAAEVDAVGSVVAEDEKQVKKKEVFVIQHRKSNDRRPEAKGDFDGLVPSNAAADVSDPCPESGSKGINGAIGGNILAPGVVVRTSSCTKEEVDAILIQCGRLSRSSSGKGNGSCENRSGSRKYSGSKRSHDFDAEVPGSEDAKRNELNSEENDDEERQRRRQSRGSQRRRTPSRSRERDQQQQQQQRSGSRERGTTPSSGSGSGRRVSRSPGRRSESPGASNGGNASSSSTNPNPGAAASGSSNGKPGKMVSVPATVSSLSVDKTSNGGDVKRVLVKRNVGEGGGASRGAASPRSQSPARVNGGNGGKLGATSPRSQSPARANDNNNQQQQQPTLSRNSSRKAEHSPFRRTPLTEIDVNSLPFQPLPQKPGKAQQKSKEIEEDVVMIKHPPTALSQSKPVETTVKVGTHRRTRSRGGEINEIANINYCKVNEHQPDNKEEYDAILTPVIVSGTDTLRLPQTLMRSRSLRRSRDLDIKDDVLNTTPNYNSLLLQDIQNFHQNSNSNSSNSNPTASGPFTLPSCLSKACSILEAVADLNSSTGSSLSSAVAQRSPLASNFNPIGQMRGEPNDPFVESEVNAGDDLLAPSLHKYVTVRKKGADEDEQESSGSNSFVGSQQNNCWVSSSSCWEPNSADSTDCWNKTQGEEGRNLVSFERLTVSEPVAKVEEEMMQRKLSKNRRESSMEHQQSGTARVRASAAGRGGLSTVPSMAAAAAST